MDHERTVPDALFDSDRQGLEWADTQAERGKGLSAAWKRWTERAGLDSDADDAAAAHSEELLHSRPMGVSELAASLAPSWLQALQRGPERPVLDAVAACIRHRTPLLMQVACGGLRFQWSLNPDRKVMRSALTLDQFLALPLDQFKLLSLYARTGTDAAATRLAPFFGSSDSAFTLPVPGPGLTWSPLAPALWALALRGPQSELLPALAGSVSVRIPRGTELHGLTAAGYGAADDTLAQALLRLREGHATLAEMAHWPGFDAQRARRLLNALYLHSALIVSRTHPTATRSARHLSDPSSR